MTWRSATATAVREEAPGARTIAFRVPDWPGHLAGQHVDMRLTAPDGYTAVRSYSVGSAPGSTQIELTVAAVPDGEVSSYLVGELAVGDVVEVRGPIGGWFVWRPEETGAAAAPPLQLVAGGVGLVPLMAMLRTHRQAGSRTPVRLLYSVRDPASVLYGAELEGAGDVVTLAYTRSGPADVRSAPRAPGRVDAALVDAACWPADLRPACFVCGPTGFVESAADLLLAAGHDPARIRTERFGPTGGPG